MKTRPAAELCRPPASLRLPDVILEARQLIFHRCRRMFLLISATAVLPLALSHALLSTSTTLYPALTGTDVDAAPHPTTFLSRAVFLLVALLYSIRAVAFLTRAATDDEEEDANSSVEYGLSSSVPPALWTRLAATVLLGAAAHACLHAITTLAVSLSSRALGRRNDTLLGLAAFLLICLAHVAALVAVGVLRHLAAAACVLQGSSSWGVDAFRAAVAMVRGREWEASAAFLAHHVPFAAAEAVFAAVLLARGGDAWGGKPLGPCLRIVCGAAAVLVMTAVITSGMTVAAVACAALLPRGDEEEVAGVGWPTTGIRRGQEGAPYDTNDCYYVLLKGHHHQQAGRAADSDGAVAQCQT